MTDEIKELREEIAKLRERIAVLEARPVAQPLRFVGPATPGHGDPWPPTVVPVTQPTIMKPSTWTVGDPPGWWKDSPTAGDSLPPREPQ